jgi:hypothetical protein
VLDGFTIERGDFARLAGKQVAARRVEQRRVDGAEKRRDQRDQQQHDQYCAADAHGPVALDALPGAIPAHDRRRLDRQRFVLPGVGGFHVNT